jgi:hypothetical protein
MRNRTALLIWALALLSAAAFGATNGFNFTHPNPQLVSPEWPDPRAVRWEVERVDGFILERPGDKTRIALPFGTLLYIPHPAREGYADSTTHSS